MNDTTIDSRWRHAVGLTLAATLLLGSAAVAADPQDPARPDYRIELGAPVTPYVFDGDVRDLAKPPGWKPGDAVREIPRRFYPAPGDEAQYVGAAGAGGIDPLVGEQLATRAAQGGGTFTVPSRNFPGEGFTGANPPDTVGEVGPNHYIQMVNGGGTVVTIFDKAEPTPNEIATFSLDSLGSGQCANGLGDPIVLYDRLAERWMLSEFSSSGNNLCVYISQTPDPVSGGWFNYGYTAPSFPDYPKYGVWPTDAGGGDGSYVVTANDGGPGIYALDRGAMLAGSPGTYQRVTIPGLPGFGFESPTPADLDMPNPPASGAPAMIMRHRDTENHSGPSGIDGDVLEMWYYQIDWIDPGSSTITKQSDIVVSEFDSNLCGLTSFNCFPQPGTGTQLDPLREVIMNRLQYINFDDYETLVGNLVTDIDGNDTGGLRWFELRRVGGPSNPWTLHQEGTYSQPDGHSRFMAASAMDQSGNIAIAYNISSSSEFPGLRYTGRLADDPAGVMTQAESIIGQGTASNSSNRYGDYAAMNLDPSDDCTFWFTSLFNTSSSWRTQIASFRFDACGCELVPDSLAITAAVGGDNRIDIDWTDSSFDFITEYRVRRATSPGGPYSTIAVVADATPGAAGGNAYSFSDTTVSGGSTYYYLVRASDGAACTSDDSNEASITATGQCTLEPLFDGLVSADTPFNETCQLDLSWDPATVRCGGPATYTIHRSQDENFVPGFDNQIATGVGGTGYSDLDSLDSGAVYYYVVRATDTANGTGDANLIRVAGSPLGTTTTGTWVDDAGDTGFAKMIMESPWSVDGSEGNLGPNVYKTGNYGNQNCADLTTPELLLGAGSQLSFASRYDIETNYDKGVVEISTDNGTTWTRVEVGYPQNVSNATGACGLPAGTYFNGSDTTFAGYGADLSAWAGELVRVRFRIGSDGSVTGDGWWIDDIAITQAEVPGECTAGSSCEDNPFVSVGPDGPLVKCEGEPEMLTASLTGGVGPFSFQWTRDGEDIPGADGQSYMANDTGLHTYNVKVRAATCPDDVRDGASSVIEWRRTPVFDGIQQVSNAEAETCTLDLAWNPGTTVCGGPVTYSVYRSPTSPVAITPANLLKSGLGSTAYSDAVGVADGEDYFYVVRATDEATGLQDGNVLELGGTAGSPFNGPQLAFFEDFSNSANFAQWTVTTGPGDHAGGEWALSNAGGQRPVAADGQYIVANNTYTNFFPRTSTSVDSPAIDTAFGGAVGVRLGYDVWFNAGTGETATVEVWDGAAWQVLWTGSGSVNTSQEWDVTAAALGNPDFKVRFNYQDAISDNWFSVDNVYVIVDVVIECSTGTAGPSVSNVPDGTTSGTPMRSDRLSVAGDQLGIVWNTASCSSTDYNLLWGNLANVGTTALAGSECSMGPGGNYTWNGAPAGDLFFVVVGTDGQGTESSWGRASGGVERGGAAASGSCGVTAKTTAAVCP